MLLFVSVKNTKKKNKIVIDVMRVANDRRCNCNQLITTFPHIKRCQEKHAIVHDDYKLNSYALKAKNKSNNN